MQHTQNLTGVNTQVGLLACENDLTRSEKDG